MSPLQIKGDGGNHLDELGLQTISRVRQYTIPDMAGTSPNPECKITHMRSSQPNQSSRFSVFSYPLISSTSFSSSSPSPFFLVHYCAIIAEQKVKSTLSNPPFREHELSPSTAYTEYKHTPSTAYSKYSIHRSTVSTQDQLSSLHSHDYELTTECSVTIRLAPLHDRPPSGSAPCQQKGTVTFPDSHG